MYRTKQKQQKYSKKYSKSSYCIIYSQFGKTQVVWQEYSKDFSCTEYCSIALLIFCIIKQRTCLPYMQNTPVQVSWKHFLIVESKFFYFFVCLNILNLFVYIMNVHKQIVHIEGQIQTSNNQNAKKISGIDKFQYKDNYGLRGQKCRYIKQQLDRDYDVGHMLDINQ